LLARFPVLDSVRVALLLAAASTLLSVLIVALFSFREASQHDPSVSSVALHQFLWSPVPCAAGLSLAIQGFGGQDFARDRTDFDGYAVCSRWPHIQTGRRDALLANYGNLALAAGALVFLMLVIEAIIRRVRAAPG
jgi:hypothetical protein